MWNDVRLKEQGKAFTAAPRTPLTPHHMQHFAMQRCAAKNKTQQ